MRILLINDYGTATGGAEITILQLREELIKRGHEVKLFTSSAQVAGQTTRADASCFGTTTRWRAYLQACNFSAYFRLRKLLREWTPDVIHVSLFLTQLSPLILPLFKRIPAIWHLHWYRGICLTGNKHLPTNAHCKFDYGRQCLAQKCAPPHQWLFLMGQMNYFEKRRNVFRRIVANSEFVKNAYEKAGYKNIKVIRCGVKPAPKGDLPEFAAQPLIVFAGRLVAEKGVDLLLRAFADVLQKIPAARLTIAGEGAEKGKLQLLAAKLKISAQVCFAGNIAPEELAQQFADAWVQVVPSLHQEPLGLTAIEAMQRGTPVIATRVGGLSEIIAHAETGLLVSPNQTELTDAVLQILENKNLRNNLRNNAFKFAGENLNLARYADEFLAVYREISD